MNAQAGTKTSRRANADAQSQPASVVLVCGADDRFAMPLAVMLYSALDHLRADYSADLFVIDGGISKNKKSRIERALRRTKKAFQLHWVPYDVESITSVQTSAAVSRASYLRLFIPDLLPAYNKAIYLDCDIVVNADLALLWEMEFADEPAMGVQDYYHPYASSNGALTHLEDGSTPGNGTYCNTGVMVLNLAYWRRHRLRSRVFNYLQSNVGRLKHFDQAGINAVIGGKWKLLDPRWNVSLSSLSSFGTGLSLNTQEVSDRLTLLREEPHIIHYTSRHKPWHTGSGSQEALCNFYFDQRFRRQFFQYLKKSGWMNPLANRVWTGYREAVLLLGFKIPRRLQLAVRQRTSN